jgi:hypothetical protein
MISKFSFCQTSQLIIATTQVNVKESHLEWSYNRQENHHTTTPPHHHHRTGDDYIYGTSRQPRKLIFGMHPYFNSTRRNMEDDLNFFENGR